ncbi:hypothetical protein TrVFT333_011681 [Trichoderma virens FT-333]|nr:hypothetical protein TrVFT333_011681 [Trichoderma virens FT-333]
MPTHRDRKNPSTGTKVNPGRDAPVNLEAAGLAASGSLAAESIQKGGEFAQNRTAQPEAMSGSNLESQSGSAGEAPENVTKHHGKGTKRSQGKEMKEGVGEEAGKWEDGLERALRSEPGSEDDPSRLAEAQMMQRQSLGALGAKPRQSGLKGETMYDALDNEVSFRHREDMPIIPEEKSSLRPPRPSEVDSERHGSTDDSKQREGRRDAARNTDVPSEQDINDEEMEHQRYGEAQPQLVPTDMIETMISAQGRKKDSLSDA